MPSLHPRAKKDLLAMGYEYVEITEHWVAFPVIPGQRRKIKGVRKDLMGFADLLALGGPDHGPTAVQVTSTGNMSARRKKILGSPVARLWCDSGMEVLLLGYCKNKKGRYERREEWISW